MTPVLCDILLKQQLVGVASKRILWYCCGTKILPWNIKSSILLSRSSICDICWLIDSWNCLLRKKGPWVLTHKWIGSKSLKEACPSYLYHLLCYVVIDNTSFLVCRLSLDERITNLLFCLSRFCFFGWLFLGWVYAPIASLIKLVAL